MSTSVPATTQPKGESKIAVIAAILGNIAVGIVKFIAAAISGSSAMVSEGVHSIVDSGNGILILFGMHQSKKQADVEHPFGYGKELYFWTLVVSVLIFALGGGVSIMEGIRAVMGVDPTAPMGDPTVSYVVLIAAAAIEGTSLFVALKQFNLARRALGMGPIEFIKQAKDPSMYTVVLEDSAAEAGLIFAFLGIFIGHATGNPYMDGVASIVIGCLLCLVAAVLLRETKGLLIGEGMRAVELEEIQQMVEADSSVQRCGRILTMYMGPTDLMVAIDASFKPDVPAAEVLTSIDRIESEVVSRFPQTANVFIEAESLKQVNVQYRDFEAMQAEETGSSE